MVYRGGRSSHLDDECASPFFDDSGLRSGDLDHRGRSDNMVYFVGLDVSVKATSVCVVDDAGKVIFGAENIDRGGPTGSQPARGAHQDRRSCPGDQGTIDNLKTVDLGRFPPAPLGKNFDALIERVRFAPTLRWGETDSNHRSRRHRDGRGAGPRSAIVFSRDNLCLMTPSSLSVRHLRSATA